MIREQVGEKLWLAHPQYHPHSAQVGVAGAATHVGACCVEA